MVEMRVHILSIVGELIHTSLDFWHIVVGLFDLWH